MDCAKGHSTGRSSRPKNRKTYLGVALRTIDQRQWPKDRPTTLEKTDNARTGAFALNESRPGAMTKPWRRSWEKGPPLKERRNSSCCRLSCQSHEPVGGCFPNTESGAASAQTCRRARKTAAGRELFARTGFMAKAAEGMNVRRHDRPRAQPHQAAASRHGL